MPVADPSFGWQEAVAAFAIISVVAFSVTWVVTDLGRVSRTPYVAILTLTTLALAAGYLAWSGTSVADLVTAGWGWGILGGVVAAALVAPLVGRLPSGPRPEGAHLVGRFLWEGVVYGNRGSDPARDPAGPGCVAGRRRARLDGHRMGKGGLGRTRGGRSAVRDRGAPPRIPGVPGEGRQEDALGCAGGLRHPGVGVHPDGKPARPGRRPHRAALAVDAPRQRDASRVGGPARGARRGSADEGRGAGQGARRIGNRGGASSASSRSPRYRRRSPCAGPGAQWAVREPAGPQE